MTTWDELAAGSGCPFDAPRAPHTARWDAVATLRAATLYLPHNQTYRGHCIFVFDPRHATRLDELAPDEWAALRRLASCDACDHGASARRITSTSRPSAMSCRICIGISCRATRPTRAGVRRSGPPTRDDLDRRLEPADRAGLLDALRTALPHVICAPFSRGAPPWLPHAPNYRPARADLAALLRLAAPVVFVQLGLMAMGVVDTIMVGRVSADGARRVALGNIYFFAIAIFGLGVLMALDPLVSQAVGARDELAVSRGVQRGIVLAMVLTVPVSLLMLPVEPVLRVVGQPPT